MHVHADKHMHTYMHTLWITNCSSYLGQEGVVKLLFRLTSASCKKTNAAHMDIETSNKTINQFSLAIKEFKILNY